MRKVTKNDEEKVVDIITATFLENPGVNWLLRKGGSKEKKVRTLAAYAFIKAFLRDGVYLSSNEKGVALCYKYNLKIFSLKEFLYELKFALFAIDLRRVRKVLQREAYRKSIRPLSGEYLYFWFFGVLPGGEGAAYELGRAIFKKAQVEKTPIYLETAMERNQRIYERFGFRTYHYWEDKKENIQFWFMKWEVPCTS